MLELELRIFAPYPYKCPDKKVEELYPVYFLPQLSSQQFRIEMDLLSYDYYPTTAGTQYYKLFQRLTKLILKTVFLCQLETVKKKN